MGSVDNQINLSCDDKKCYICGRTENELKPLNDALHKAITDHIDGINNHITLIARS